MLDILGKIHVFKKMFVLKNRRRLILLCRYYLGLGSYILCPVSTLATINEFVRVLIIVFQNIFELKNGIFLSKCQNTKYVVSVFNIQIDPMCIKYLTNSRPIQSQVATNN